MFQRLGGLDSDQLLQQRTGTAPRPWAGKKCDLSVPSASPGARSCYWAWSGCGTVSPLDLRLPSNLPLSSRPVRPEHDRVQSCAIALRSPASEPR
eukprot:scaffold88421_cov75-Phaeocystis_antarctica.AAC.3